MTTYRFRRCDNGQIVELDFGAMMGKDVLGYVTLPDGVQAREIRESSRSRASDGSASSVERTIVSSALGFSELQLADFEADRQAHGFTGIEFVRDPHEPTFYNVKFSGRAERDRYLAHRGARDQSKRLGSGATISKELLERAEQLARRKAVNR